MLAKEAIIEHLKKDAEDRQKILLIDQVGPGGEKKSKFSLKGLDPRQIVLIDQVRRQGYPRLSDSASACLSLLLKLAA